VKYLLDTNIWLERMLGQERATDVAELLTRVPADRLGMTDFTLHSIGVILNRLKQRPTYVSFVQDVLLDGLVQLLTVPPDAMAELIDAAEKFGLDFDDAYQYIAARRHDLTIISLDGDFDRTDLGRRTPGEIIQALDAEFDVEIEYE